MNMQETFSTRAAGTSPSGYVVLRPQLPKFKTFMVAFARTSPIGCVSRGWDLCTIEWTIESVY